MRAETRHSLKQDKFSRTIIDKADWTVQHRSILTTAAIAIIVVAAIVIGTYFYLSGQEEKASLALSQAIRTSETPIRPANMPPQPGFPSFASATERDTDARKQYQEIVNKFSHTRSADVARYLLGVSSANLGDYSAAEKDLQTVSSVFNKDLSSMAKFTLASVYRKDKKEAQAIDIYKQLSDKPTNTVSKVTVQFELADLYMQKQQPLEAKRIYEQIQKENPATESAALAQSKAAQIK
ncbi:MAG TPA: tetratricopeptide repeat protein [Terriglobales bacterium]|nr:tetratricopeptide repeat protein [Terriglobales bacterium]